MDLNMDEDSLYFEFELKLINSKDESEEELLLLKIKDITKIVRMQQKQSNKIYEDAIEANYSHEFMTPLNCIIANSQIIQKR